MELNQTHGERERESIRAPTVIDLRNDECITRAQQSHIKDLLNIIHVNGTLGIISLSLPFLRRDSQSLLLCWLAHKSGSNSGIKGSATAKNCL
jgi:hypothetical protein